MRRIGGSMKIYLVYTHDAYDYYSARRLRGITTNRREAETMKLTLAENDVEDEDKIGITALNDGDFDDCGGWLY